MDPRRLRHSAWKLVGGVTSRSVGEKIQKVTNIVYFTYLPRSPRYSDPHHICSGGWFLGRNQLCQISFQSVQGFWFCRGSNFGLSHRNEVSLLTQGLNYRSACDMWAISPDRKWIGYHSTSLSSVKRFRILRQFSNPLNVSNTIWFTLLILQCLPVVRKLLPFNVWDHSV